MIKHKKINPVRNFTSSCETINTFKSKISNGVNHKNIIFNLAFGLACLISVCLFWEKPILLTMILAILSLIGLYKWKNKETFILFILVGFSGALTEATMIYFGVWTYTLPNIIGVPYWLFILWGNAAIFIYQMAIEIKNLI